MILNPMADKQIHQGRNVRRFREMLGIKQDALAIDLDLSQQTISTLESKETIDPALLERIAKVLKVPAEAIKSFSEEAMINYVSNTYNDSASSNDNYGHFYNINPVEKWIEAMEENKKLYERLLESEQQKVAMLERLLSNR